MQPLAAAEVFFAALADSDGEKAHRLLDAQLRSQISVEGLAEFIAYTGLSGKSKRTWSDPEIVGDKAVLRGDIRKPENEQVLPIRISMQQSGGDWRISGIERGVAVFQDGHTIALYAPPRHISIQMAGQVTKAFNDAVKIDDLTGFWADMSIKFRRRFSADDFAQAFIGFIEDDVDLSPALQVDPKLTSPATIDAAGELLLQGRFPTRPSEVVFAYRFLHENGDWRLSGIQIELQPVDEPVPDSD